MRYERRYDLKNFTRPADCRGCRFGADKAIVDQDCPVHGAYNTSPIVGPPDWPALVTVPVEE